MLAISDLKIFSALDLETPRDRGGVFLVGIFFQVSPSCGAEIGLSHMCNLQKGEAKCSGKWFFGK